MGKIEEDYKLELTVEYHRCIRELAQAEIEKRDTSKLFDKVLNIQQKIAALDIEMKIDEITENERMYKK